MGFLIMIYVLGLLVAIGLFVFLFVKIYGGKKVMTSAALTIATWLFIYVIFVVILHARLYTGILRISL